MEISKKIEAFLEESLSEKEMEAFRQQLKLDSNLANQVKQQKVELLVIDRLERMDLESQKERFKQIEEAFKAKQTTQQPTLIRRIFAGVAIAASVLLLVWFGNNFLFPGNAQFEPVASWNQGDYNIKRFPFDQTILPHQIIGNWKTTIQQADGTGLAITMSCEENKNFTIKATFIKENTPQEGDNMTAAGTYSIEGSELLLSLNMDSIKNGSSANPFNTGPIEQWLKNNRLFRAPLTIVSLTAENLVVQYNQEEGVLWSSVQ